MGKNCIGAGLEWIGSRGIGPAFGESSKYNQDIAYHEEMVVEVEHLRAHEIFGTNSAEDHDITPNSLITKNTNTTVGIKTSKGLSYL